MKLDSNEFQYVNSLSTDYLSEAIIASLIEKGIDVNSIKIVRVGNARSSVGKDIERICLEPDWENEDNDCIKIYVNREGLYDILPEGIFFQGNAKMDSEDIKIVVEQIKKQRREENDIRKFFSVFENEIDLILVQTQLLERKIDRNSTHPDFAKIFTEFWPIINLMTLKQSVLFMRIIPIIHRIRGNNKSIEKALTLLIGLPIQVKSIIKEKKATQMYKLGECRLEGNMVIGNTMYDGLHDMQVIVNEIPQNRIAEFLKNGKSFQIIRKMIDMLFPADMEVEIKLNAKQSEASFQLSNKETLSFPLGMAYI